MSLNTKMALAVSLLTTALLAGMTFSVLSYFERQIKAIVSGQQFTMVTAMADEIDQKITAVQNQLRAVAGTATENSFSSPRSARAFVGRSQSLADLFDSGLLVFGPHGELLHATLAGQGPAREPQLRKLLAVTVREKKPHISEPFRQTDENGEPVVMFSHPVLASDGTVKGVLVGGVSLLRDNFLGKIATIRLGRNGYLYLYDTDRTLIFHQNRSRILKRDVRPGVNRLFDKAIEGFEGAGETQNSGGVYVLGAFKRLKTVNWILVANYPVPEAYEPVYRARNYVLAGLLAAVLLANLVIWRFMQYLTAPLRTFISHVDAIGATDGPHTPFTIDRHDEIGTLGRAFNRMMAEVTRRQEALEEQLGFSRTLINSSAVPTFVLDTDHRVLIWNPACEKLTGLTADEAIGTGKQWQPFYSCQRPCLADIVIDGTFREVAALYDSGSFGPSEMVANGLRAEGWYDIQGERRYLFFNAAPVYNTSGELIAAIETLEDITWRKRTEEELRKLSAAVTQSPVSIVITDREGRIEYANPKFSALTGFDLSDVVGRYPSVLKSGETPVEEYHRLWDTIASGGTWHGEFHNRRRDGSLYWEEALIAPIKDDTGTITHYVAIKEDISERKALEGQLRHAQKMEAVGKLASGVAHDFNNILTAIVGYASIMQMQSPEDHGLCENVDQILRAAERGAKVTQALLSFGRKRDSHLIPVDLNDVVGRAERLLAPFIGEDIRLHIHRHGAPLVIQADSIQIEQVIVNLATNARDAMPSGGDLTVKTGRCSMDQSFCSRHGFGLAGEYAVLIVADSGDGIDGETLKRIYEPFFTTKEVGKGSGLGLSIIYGIVKGHGGYITCYSEPGRGTQFSIYLPLTLAQLPADGGSVASEAGQGSEVILLAEDDDSVRHIMKSLLEEFGYTVLESVNGREVISRFADHRDRVALVILDVIMPEVNGKEAADAILQLNPDVRILFSSGYAEEVVRAKGIDLDRFPFLGKPVVPAKMLRMVREVLDR